MDDTGATLMGRREETETRGTLDTGHWTVSLQSHHWEHLTITNIVCVSHLDHEQPVSRRHCLVQVQPLSGREAHPRQEHLGAPHHHRGGVAWLIWTQKWVGHDEKK